MSDDGLIDPIIPEFPFSDDSTSSSSSDSGGFEFLAKVALAALEEDTSPSSATRKSRSSEVSSDRTQCSEEISDASSSKIIYAGAVLDVCYRKLGFYPEVVSFVQHEMVKFPSVKGQYSHNQPPKLIMLDDVGQCKEIVRIDNWKREQILKFLRENLKPTSGV